MALTEFETERYKLITEKFVESRRPPEHIRSQLDIGYSLDGQSITIFEIRPVYNKPDKIMHSEAAKLTYVITTDSWKIYWMRADLKWHSYQTVPEVDSLEQGLEVINEDQYGAFWG